MAIHSKPKTSILTGKPSVHFTRLQPTRGWVSLKLGELWRYRELLVILAMRDVRLRYKQTVLGVIWVVLQPLLAALIFAVIFGLFAKLPSDGTPYLLFAYTGLVGWNYFAGAIQRSGESLVNQVSLITKVYFPRMLIPLSNIVAVLVDLAVSLVVLIVMLIIFQVFPGWQILSLPFFLLLILLVAAGAGLWLSALSVYYRDFLFVLPFLVQVLLYATPVVYSGSIVPEKWRGLYALNPLVAGIEGIRWAVLGRSIITWQIVLTGGIVAGLIFLSGLFFFRRVERGFADRI